MGFSGERADRRPWPQGSYSTVWKFFNDAFSQDSRLGYGSAMAYTLFVIIMLFSVVGFRLSRGKDGKGE